MEKLDLEKINVEHWDEQKESESRREVWGLGARIEKLKQFEGETSRELKRIERQIDLLFHQTSKITEKVNEIITDKK